MMVQRIKTASSNHAETAKTGRRT